MNILISSAGRRVSLVRAFQKEAKKIDAGIKVFASDASPILSAACQIADDYFKVPLLSTPDYIDVLLEECTKRNIKIIIPTIDTELTLLAKKKELLEKNGIIPSICDVGLIEKCRDKRLIHDFFRAFKVQVAQEYSKEEYSLPMFLKPWDGSRSVDTFLIYEEKDITEYHLAHEKLMFLEYLDHSIYTEYTCDLYYGRDNELKCVVPRKRILVRDGEVNKGVTENNALVPYIKKRLNKVEGAVGCLTAQFFLHKDGSKIYGIEINPRFGGGYPLSYLAGANFPRWILQEYFLNEKIPPQFDCWESNLLMLRYDNEVLVHAYKD